jgi:hypothetical protein
MTKLKTGMSSYNVSIGRDKNYSQPTQKPQVGKVYGVVTTENTPTKELFEQAQGFGGIGTIFYKNYNVSKDSDEDINQSLTPAAPLFSQIQNIPLIGELVYLIDLPSPVSQISQTSGQKYYITLNLWNSVQQNAQPASKKTSLGPTFIENPNVRRLIPFIGDYIIQGRQGNALRFSTTTKQLNEVNEWSLVGNDIDPITILTNGLDFDPNKGYYVEQINKDASSIYLTSAQKISLQTDKTGVLNNLTNPLNVPDYTYAQTILNSDRIVLNSKKDEVMIFAKTNIELNTKNVINLNADERIHLNSGTIFLGPYDSNNIPQPVLLGYDTMKVFEQLQETLTRLAFYLSSAVSAPEGAPIISLNNAGNELLSDMKKVCDLLENTTSKKVFTS